MSMFKALVLVLTTCAQGGGLGEFPADGEVLRAIPQRDQGIPFVYEVFRDDIIIVKNRLVKQELPVALPAGVWLTVEVASYECVVYYTETVEMSFPFPIRTAKKQVQVVFMEKVAVGPMCQEDGLTRY
jgi:hypothetical protein